MAQQNSDDALLIEMGLSEREYVAALKRIEAKTARTAKQNEDRFRSANKNVARSFDRVDKSASSAASGGLRQASMQLSQVAQQGAATGNYLQALAIQAPDLALGFGALGIAAGAVIPILYGVATAAMGTQEELEKIDVQAAYSSATSAIDAARAAQDRYTAAVRLSGVAQSEVTSEVLANLRLEAQAREALAALEVERLDRQRRALEANLEANRQKLEELLSTVNQGLEFDPNAEFANTEVERARLQATQDVLDAHQDLLSTIREQQAEVDLVNALLAQGESEASRIVGQLIDATTNAEGVASAASGISGAIEPGVASALRLAEALGISLERARLLAVTRANMQDAKTYSGRGGDPRDFMEGGSQSGENYRADIDYKPVTEVISDLTPSVSSKGGSGGSRSGGKSEAQRQAEKETNRLLSERDRILRSLKTPMQEYERKLADLNRLQDMGELTTDQYNAALGRLDEELRDAEWGAVLEGIESVSDAMADAIVNGENMGQALARVFRQMASDILSAGIQEALSQAFTGAGNGGGIFQGIGTAIGGALSGGRAAGGVVRAGEGYMVGENGREPFFPAVNGRILSTQQAQQALRGATQAAAPTGHDVDVRVHMDRDGNWQAEVERISVRKAQQASGQMAGKIQRSMRTQPKDRWGL